MPEEYKKALINRDDNLGDLLGFIQSFEKLNTEELDYYLDKYSLVLENVSKIYLESLYNANKTLSGFN